ncbi:MAG: hypothetical protein ABSA39_20060 [Edaphobacter sp.]
MSHFITPIRKRIALLILVAATSTAALYAAFQALTPAPAALSSFVPQGSLLAMESPDFAALLKSWSASSEQRAWLASDNYAAFSRSRLFARLNEAQDQFATSAGLPPDMQFLQQVAGKQSIFAWYDIGNLQFLYITRLPPGAAEQTPLLQLRGKFQLRKSGDDSFYLRAQGDPERTVAFAVHGDYLLLATREDLLANALLLMQHPDETSLHNESWYSSVMAANAIHSSDQPALRMALNLTRILPTPYFRSYWIQQNITELKHYSAALSDLYLTNQDFREERVLLPIAAAATVPTADLAPILQYLPLNAGVYRATAHPTTDQALDALNDKLLARTASSFRDQHLAPVVDLSVQNTGSATDLETRIDTPPIPEQPITAALAPLRSLLDAAPLDALLLYTSTTTSQHGADGLFLPIHTAVILSASTPFVPSAIQSALTQALSARLTVSTASLYWETRQEGGAAYFQLSGLEPLAFSVQGNFCILASDSETLLQIMESAHQKSPQPFIASTAAGFNHTAERPGLNRLSTLLDRTNASPQSGDSAPAFFSRNLGSLSQTFQSLDSESFTETVQAQSNAAYLVNQKVIYKWRP